MFLFIENVLLLLISAKTFKLGTGNDVTSNYVPHFHNSGDEFEISYSFNVFLLGL